MQGPPEAHPVLRCQSISFRKAGGPIEAAGQRGWVPGAKALSDLSGKYLLNDSRIYPIYRTAQDLGIPVLIHTGSSTFPGTRLKYGDPLLLDDVAVDFPDSLKLVIAHSGRGFWYDRAFFMSKLHKNVYMEIAGLPPFRLLDYFPDLGRNADKVIFGSDWPGMPHIKRNIEAVAELPLPPAAVEKILGGNAAGLLGLNSQRIFLTVGRHPAISTIPPARNSSSGSECPGNSALICRYRQQRQVFFLTPEIARI